ncbi:MAG: alpha-ketoacid dehydrogenase subunit beta, partial [Candidatus Micrarchaeaceae archaeon]
MQMNMVNAINNALAQIMEENENVVLLGEDIGKDGGVFRVTEGLLDKFGENRVIDTPLAESAIIGTSIGMALAGL